MTAPNKRPAARNPAALELRRLRDIRGWSQAKLAARLRLSQQQVSKLEAPDGNPTIQSVDRAIGALGYRTLIEFGRGRRG